MRRLVGSVTVLVGLALVTLGMPGHPRSAGAQQVQDVPPKHFLEVGKSYDFTPIVQGHAPFPAKLLRVGSDGWVKVQFDASRRSKVPQPERAPRWLNLNHMLYIDEFPKAELR